MVSISETGDLPERFRIFDESGQLVVQFQRVSNGVGWCSSPRKEVVQMTKADLEVRVGVGDRTQPYQKMLDLLKAEQDRLSRQP